MTQLQGWLLVIIAAIGVGYLVLQAEAAKPTNTDRVMNEHYRQMCSLTGQNCNEYDEDMR